MKAKNFKVCRALILQGMQLRLQSEMKAILKSYGVDHLSALPNFKAPFVANKLHSLINNKNKSQNGI